MTVQLRRLNCTFPQCKAIDVVVGSIDEDGQLICLKRHDLTQQDSKMQS